MGTTRKSPTHSLIETKQILQAVQAVKDATAVAREAEIRLGKLQQRHTFLRRLCAVLVLYACLITGYSLLT